MMKQRGLETAVSEALIREGTDHGRQQEKRLLQREQTASGHRTRGRQTERSEHPAKKKAAPYEENSRMDPLSGGNGRNRIWRQPCGRFLSYFKEKAASGRGD